MTPLQEQFEVLKAEFPQAILQELPSGTALIIVDNFPLPNGWSHTTTTVRFLAPVGYPFAKPDCFWSDNHIRLGNQAPPQNTGSNAIPEVEGNFLWFSWHVGQWNPNRDNLSTYMKIIGARFKELK